MAESLQLPRLTLSQSLAIIQKRWPRARSPATDEPVFLMSAGWRSGSTLLQRMMLGRCLVWGEPFGPHGLIDRMAQPLCFFWEQWPPDDFFIDHPTWKGDLRQKWTANLYPPPELMPEAHADFFRRLFAGSAAERGYARWGIKMVRQSVEHAFYLRWIFPRCRLVLLVRNPYDCWLSYRRAGGMVIKFYPSEPVRTPEQFGQHWLELTAGFARRAAEVNARFLRYEDLVAPSFDPRPLQEYLGFDLDLAVRQIKTGASPPGVVPFEEVARLHRIVGEVASHLGYLPPVV